MAHQLRPDISYCDVAGQLVFLDLHRDRYFCLTGASATAFRRLADGGTQASSDWESLAWMVADGVLVEGTAPLSRPTLVTPLRSLVDDDMSRASAGAIALAIAQITRARIALRFFGLKRTLGSVRPKRRKPPCASPDAKSAGVASAFRQAGLIVSSLDRCLPRSIAIARRCHTLGVAVDLVIGVRLQPFAAHCWVQQGDCIVSDRLDTVRTFTPILVR